MTIQNHFGEFRMLTSSSLFTCLDCRGVPSCMLLRRLGYRMDTLSFQPHPIRDYK